MVDNKIAVIGLGYVGLPLAEVFSKNYRVIGFDKDENLIDSLKEKPRKNSTTSSQMKFQSNLSISSDLNDVKDCDVYIVTVPTPIDRFHKPDLTALINATEMIGRIISKGNFVIFESTVYPGTTEDICKKLLEDTSRLVCSRDFYIGYSPERVSPGKGSRSVKDIKKLTSGCCDVSSDFIYRLYDSIIDAGVFNCKSIKVAEASKILENVQRDVNIAIINEATKIFSADGISIYEVLNAASTKWNFLNFTPGLVGGHCIGIDPYYLLHKAKEFEINAEVISASRQCNENMVNFVADRLMELKNQLTTVSNGRILIVGLAFKENCKDIRNSKQVTLIQKLEKYHKKVIGFDPIIDKQLFHLEYPSISIHEKILRNHYDIIALMIPHDELSEKDYEYVISGLTENGILFDFKNRINRKDSRIIKL